MGSTKSSPSAVTATVTAASRKESGTEASRSARQAAFMQVATKQPPSCKIETLTKNFKVVKEVQTCISWMLIVTAVLGWRLVSTAALHVLVIT